MSIISTFPEKKGLNTDDINDIASGEISNGFVQSPYCYSTTEQVIGKWIDGKPLYQKSIVYSKSQLQGSGEKYYAHGLSNVKKIWFVSDASFIDTVNSTGNLHWTMFCNNGTINYNFTGVWSKPTDGTYNGLSIYIGTGLWSIIDADPNAYMVITLRYTKTTD